MVVFTVVIIIQRGEARAAKKPFLKLELEILDGMVDARGDETRRQQEKMVSFPKPTFLNSA